MTHPPEGKRAAPATVKYSQGHPPSLEEVAEFDNLLHAYRQASKGKRGRFGCFRFTESLGMNLENMRRSLLDGTYQPAPCHQFEIWCTAGQKRRTITAPTFSDGVVQHAFYQRAYGVFDRGFIFDSYGCRKGKGTHKAADRIQAFMRECDEETYYLQIDIRKYYYTLDHNILQESLERKILDQRVVDYMMSFCGPGEVGLQVGCLLSQLFGMIYLDRFDHWCKRLQKVRRYVRYVDDIVMIGLTREEAYELKDRCVEFLRTHLKLELSKWRIAKLKTGINFCGFRTWKTHRFMRKRSLHNLSRRLKQRRFVSVASIMAHAMHSSSYAHMLKLVRESITEEDYRFLNARLCRQLGIPKAKYVRARRRERCPLRAIRRRDLTIEQVRKLRR